jgi:hypothetical protein
VREFRYSTLYLKSLRLKKTTTIERNLLVAVKNWIYIPKAVYVVRAGPGRPEPNNTQHARACHLMKHLSIHGKES